MPTDAVLACASDLKEALADGPLLATDVSRKFSSKYGPAVVTHARRRFAVQVIRVDALPHYCLPEGDEAA